MATTRIAAASLLTTVSQTAEAIGSVVNTLNGSVSMLNDYVTRHRQMQLTKTKVEIGKYESALVEDTVKEITIRRRETRKFLEADPVNQEIWDVAMAEVRGYLNPTPAPAEA